MAGGNDRCVFCGEPIAPDQVRAGRGDAVAHASCADRALADDAHWDRIASQTDDPALHAPDEPEAQPAGRRSGCLTLPLLLTALCLVLAAGSWP